MQRPRNGSVAVSNCDDLDDGFEEMTEGAELRERFGSLPVRIREFECHRRHGGLGLRCDDFYPAEQHSLQEDLGAGLELRRTVISGCDLRHCRRYRRLSGTWARALENSASVPYAVAHGSGLTTAIVGERAAATKSCHCPIETRALNETTTR